MDHTDKELNALRHDFEKLWPTWLEDLMLNKDPEYTDVVGYEMAKARATFVILGKMKERLKQARKNIIKDMQEKCDHPFVACEQGNHSSTRDWERKDKYVCEVCGKWEHGNPDSVGGGISPDLKRGRMRYVDNYFNIKELTEGIEP